MARTATTTQKRISKRTVSYTTKEVVCLYRSWIAISQDAICGVKQRGKAYYKRVMAYRLHPIGNPKRKV
jgi:hypothetical protein